MNKFIESFVPVTNKINIYHRLTSQKSPKIIYINRSTELTNILFDPTDEENDNKVQANNANEDKAKDLLLLFFTFDSIENRLLRKFRSTKLKSIKYVVIDTDIYDNIEERIPAIQGGLYPGIKNGLFRFYKDQFIDQGTVLNFMYVMHPRLFCSGNFRV